MKKYLAILLCLFVAWTNTPLVHAAETPSLVVSEVQTGGLEGSVENGRLEFVELYNSGSEAVDLSGWEVAYISGSNNALNEPTRLLGELQGSVAADGYMLLASPDWAANNPGATVDLQFDNASSTTSASGWLAKGGGYIRITDALGEVRDLVAWGSAPSVASWWHAPEISAGSSIRRLMPGDPNYQQAGQFAAPTTATTPLGGGLDLPSDSTRLCTGVVISEILPNASGTDAGKEYVEIYNMSANSVDLSACNLRLNDGPSFALPDELLPAGAYRAFYDTESGLTLPNATGAMVWLLGEQEEGVSYPGDLGDDQAWARIGDAWEITTKPTPGASNEQGSTETSAVIPKGDEPLSPCAPGKERNPETNRCRNVPTQTNLQPCGEGKERNQATNRCRAVLAASSQTPCKPGQERNPATNRCRSTASSGSRTLKPCAPGQERNPNTNRCRKTGDNQHLAKVQDVPAGRASASSWGWWLAGAGLLGALSYALYEWRDEIARIWRQWRTKLRRHKPT